MKIKLALGAAVCASALSAGQAAAADWDAPQQPFKVHGNTYYVGPGGVSAVLVTSPAGHVLIDGGTGKSPQQIVPHIRQLGFKVGDIKYILISHAHFDHVGGIAELQKLSGATVVASTLAAPVLKTGKPTADDPQYANLVDMPFAPVGTLHTVKDGEVLSVGPLKLTAHYSPGHTPGGTSWTWQSSENGKALNMVYADSVTAYGDDSFRYGGDPRWPGAKAGLEHTLAMLAGLQCDILISAHPDASGLMERQAKGSFVDTNACRAYAAKGQERLAAQLAEEAQRPAKK
ncbi:subclass B3 metallo-beta-lactamase [Massilia arenosa]|uniref:Subclass B3 metallo-beta-lactamase n=1 Tax=Zemynaea arenosa TaxID=2561931 RepID=A0A4Y9SHY3_9BURK|nr:subclass B3 metallo-beta-lactamase [Massilia arenosa]TFW24700.1 subclass B3 metallo-beta-lactamase [Massilia arenosa]